MDATGKSFTFLSNEGLVEIPFFQRNYVWGEDNWRDIFEDLSTKKNHFLGSLILKQQQSLTGEPKSVLVIDGQQRLTTLSVLVKALYDSFDETTRENCLVSVRSNLFYKQYQTDAQFKVRIKHSHVDAASFLRVMRAGLDAPRLENNEPVTNKIMQCYRYFRNRIGVTPADDQKALFNRLVNHDHRMLVVIDLSADDDEQSIFDTTNTAGVRLSAADIIKNALFQRAMRLMAEVEVVELYSATWRAVFSADDETVEYWDQERVTGRLTRDNAEIVLHAIAVTAGIFDPDEHSLSNLSALYKTRISQLADAGSLRQFVHDICSYAKLYRERITAIERTTALSFGNYWLRVLHILDVLQLTTFHPFVLYISKTCASDERRLKQLLNGLERFVVRNMLSRGETKNYNKLCKEFIADPDSVITRASAIKDDDVLVGIETVTNKIAALLLFWVELHRKHNDAKFDRFDLTFNYSLEHIMPQKWEHHWSELPPKANSDGTPMSIEANKVDRTKKIYSLGNMTLLTSALNSSLKNYAFEKKVNGDGRKKGIRAYGSLSITHDDIVVPFERGDRVWDESRIVNRTKELGREILAIWGSTPSDA